MRTKELLEKKELTKEEKIARLKKLGLWREFQKELKKGYGDILYSTALQYLLEIQIPWCSFLSRSFSFSKTLRGYEFWAHVAEKGKKPLK